MIYGFTQNGISIHAAREGGDPKENLLTATYSISIHAAREGGDAIGKLEKRLTTVFQSTPPVKAATCNNNGCFRLDGYFNPRRP